MHTVPNAHKRYMPTDHDAGALNLLTNEQRTSLDSQGFVILQGLSTLQWLQEVRARLEELVELEGADQVLRPSVRTEFHREPGCLRVPDLVNKGAVFDRAWLAPQVLACVHHVLQRPFKLSALSYREPCRGGGAQGLHADWDPRSSRTHYEVVNAVWAIDDFNEHNGALRLVPGSHQRIDAPGSIQSDAPAPNPEITVRVPAGSVVVMNAHTWHAGGANTSGERRRSLHAYFCGREHAQQLNQREYLRKSTWERLTPHARYLLDVS